MKIKLKHTSFLLLIILLIPNRMSAQNIILLDTLNKTYNSEISTIYANRVLEQLQVFNAEIESRSTRKAVETSYKELSENFNKNIQKGLFADQKNYRVLLDDILLKIKNNNSNFENISETKILISFGASPNAYAIGNDIIVLFVPLIKKIETEEQLAFIMCHEIAHNILQHSYKGLIERADLENSSDIRKQTQVIKSKRYNAGQVALGLYKDIVYSAQRKNRLLEHQADSLGFILFQNTYKDKTHQALVALKALENIDEETDSLTIDDYKRLFHTETSPFKQEWLNNDELKAYTYDKSAGYWKVDSLKTHPDIPQRIQLLNERFKVNETPNIKATAHYQELRNSSNYNHVLGLYVIEEYGKSLYETLLLLKNNSDNPFLKRMVYKNLIKLQEAQTNYTLNKYLETNNPNFSRSYNTFLYFLRQLRKTQLNAIINKYQT